MLLYIASKQILFSGETGRVGITTLTEGVDDVSILFLGGEVVVENLPSQELYVLQTIAEDEDGRMSATYVDLKFC